MINCQTWLHQIMGYCDLVADDAKLRQAWINRDFSQTSVTDFDELYEQVFDDLDADYFTANLHAHLPNTEPAYAAITDFIKSLKEIDSARVDSPELLNAITLLDSGQWQRVRSSALAALDAIEIAPGDN